MLFKDFVQINPKVDLKKGKRYPYVGMADVNPSRGYVTNSETREYKNSRSRFKEGDTLFARITPCLENGKITRFKSDEIKKGFGSTEFFVFRAKEGISDPNYVYYLSRSPLIRKTAEKSMAGASGRQRADISAIEEIEINPPELHRQQKIASILSAFDNLIENNTRRIAILEEMAQRIYREWFVHFRFPSAQGRRRSTAIATERYGEQATPADSKPKMVDSGTELGEIPEGWEVKKLEEVIELTYGIGLRKKDRVEGRYPVYGSSGIIDWHNDYHVEGPGVIVGRKGNVGSMFWEYENFNPIDTTYFVESSLPLTYAFFNLQNQNFINSDAAVPGLSKRQANTLPVLVPDEKILKNFDTKILQLFDLKRVLNEKNEKLKETRDLLLPKLVSGKIDVEEITVN